MRYLLTTIALFLALSINAQQLEKQVIASTGSDVSAGGMQISQTVGEIAVTTYTSGSFILGQGFQQVEEVLVDAIEELAIMVNYTLYPNPTVNSINVDLEIKNASNTLQIVIYNAIGEKIESQQVDLTQGSKTTLQFDLSAESSGLYFMKFYHHNGKEAGSIEFVKN